MPPVQPEPTGDEIAVALFIITVLFFVAIFFVKSLFSHKGSTNDYNEGELQNARYWSHKSHRYDDDPDRLNQ